MTVESKTWELYISMNAYKMWELCKSTFTYKAADSWYLNTEVSTKVLQRIKDATLGHWAVYSANFCARKPPENRKRGESAWNTKDTHNQTLKQK